MDTKAHWEQVYRSKDSSDVSWFQLEPAASLAMLDTAGITPSN